jgi:predicted nucleic acid-binding protein
MGKNDVWIAATASVLEGTLITTDTDFDHLQGEFLDRIYVDPEADAP